MWRVSVTPVTVLSCFSLYVSLIVFICSNSFLLICIFSFPLYIFRWWIISLYHFMMIHSYLPLSVKQFALLFYSFYFVTVVTIYMPVLFSFDIPYCGCNHYSFHHISFLSSTMQPSLSPLLYSLISYRPYSYTLLLEGKICVFLYSTSFYA